MPDVILKTKPETKEMRLTPEMKEKLSGFLGFSKNPIFKYVPEVYRQKDEKGNYIFPKEVWPVFTLKGRTGLEIAELEDNSGYFDTEGKKMHVTLGSQRIKMLGTNILGWSNFYDDNDELIECKRVAGEVYKTSMQRLPDKLQRELFNAINEQSRLTEEELQGLES